MSPRKPVKYSCGHVTIYRDQDPVPPICEECRAGDSPRSAMKYEWGCGHVGYVALTDVLISCPYCAKEERKLETAKRVRARSHIDEIIELMRANHIQYLQVTLKDGVRVEATYAWAET